MKLMVTIIIYVILGGYAFWVMSKLEKYYYKKLNIYGESYVRSYYAGKHYISINRWNKFYIILMPILVIALWAFWPVVTVVSCVANYVNFKHRKRDYESMQILMKKMVES